MKKKSKKLELSRETILRLESAPLVAVQGGWTNPSFASACCLTHTCNCTQQQETAGGIAG